MSSNALTLATAALVHRRLARLSDAAEKVTALSAAALQASLQAYDPRVHAGRPDASQQAVARRLMALLEPVPWVPARVQDPFALRTVPQVHAPFVDALTTTEQAVQVEVRRLHREPAGRRRRHAAAPRRLRHRPALRDPRRAAPGDLPGDRAVRGTAVGADQPVAHRAARVPRVRAGRQLGRDDPGVPRPGRAGPGTNHDHAGVHRARGGLARAWRSTRASPPRRSWACEEMVGLAPVVLGCELVAAVRALRMDPEPAARARPAARVYDAAARPAARGPRRPSLRRRPRGRRTTVEAGLPSTRTRSRVVRVHSCSVLGPGTSWANATRSATRVERPGPHVRGVFTLYWPLLRDSSAGVGRS